MYNFVIFSTPSEYYDVAYYDIKNLPNVKYIRNIRDTKNPILRILYRIHFSKKFNKLIRNPFKPVLNRFLFKNDFNDNKPICFVFNERMLYLYNFGFMEYLKSTYPNSKIVCFIQDLVSTIDDVDVRKLFKKFDLSISYDKSDSDSYGIKYYPTPYSFIPLTNKRNLKKSDVYFLGKAKNRLSDILAIYEKLKAKGLICDFYISEVRPEDQLYAEDIHYNFRLTYEENLEHVLNTRCLLEILQQGATGYTFRTWEAIMFNKLLLTNNESIDHAPFYNDNYVQICKKASDINFSFFNNSEIIIDYKFKDKLSPRYLLEFIEYKLNSKC